MFGQLVIVDNRHYELGEEWEISTHLGSGVQGHCHLAIDTETSFAFCVKKIYIEKFRPSELETWSRLAPHRNIVRLYGALRSGRYIYILMEYIGGESWKRLHTVNSAYKEH